MRSIEFTKNAFEDFLEWESSDKSIFKRIVRLIKETQRTPFEGEGQPEPLKHQFKGFWSKRIDQKHRLIYKVEEEKLIIAGCKGHYE